MTIREIKPLQVRLEPWLRDKVQARADATRRSLNAVVTELIELGFEAEASSPDITGRVSTVEQRLASIEARLAKLEK